MRDFVNPTESNHLTFYGIYNCITRNNIYKPKTKYRRKKSFTTWTKNIVVTQYNISSYFMYMLTTS